MLGSTERLPLFASVLIPLLILTLTNSFMIKNINENKILKILLIFLINNLIYTYTFSDEQFTFILLN